MKKFYPMAAILFLTGSIALGAASSRDNSKQVLNTDNQRIEPSKTQMINETDVRKNILDLQERVARLEKIALLNHGIQIGRPELKRETITPYIPSAQPNEGPATPYSLFGPAPARPTDEEDSSSLEEEDDYYPVRGNSISRKNSRKSRRTTTGR